jgi:transcriptional regulator
MSNGVAPGEDVVEIVDEDELGVGVDEAADQPAHAVGSTCTPRRVAHFMRPLAQARGECLDGGGGCLALGRREVVPAPDAAKLAPQPTQHAPARPGRRARGALGLLDQLAVLVGDVRLHAGGDRALLRGGAGPCEPDRRSPPAASTSSASHAEARAGSELRREDEADSEAPAGSGGVVHINETFELGDVDAARSIVREHPFATIVTADLRATHMPCLLDEEADGLVILGHVARADPASEALDGPVLLIFHGPHGYVSASWYGSDTIPTWNHVTLHVKGTPRLFDDALPVLRQTVEHFERAVEHPWSLERMGQTGREMADEVVAFRIAPDSWHAEAKLSQDKPEAERARVLAGLETPGPYANLPLAAAIRRWGAQDRSSESGR